MKLFIQKSSSLTILAKSPSYVVTVYGYKGAPSRVLSYRLKGTEPFVVHAGESRHPPFTWLMCVQSFRPTLPSNNLYPQTTFTSSVDTRKNVGVKEGLVGDFPGSV